MYCMLLHRALGSTALAAALLVVAAACSPIGPGAGASDPAGSGSGGTSDGSSTGTATGTATASAAVKAATCKVLGSSLDDITSTLSSTASTFVDDPSSAVSALESATTTVQGVVSEIQDPRAKTLVRDVSDDLGALTTAVQNAAEHPLTGAPGVQRALLAVQKDVAAITTYCG